MAISIADQIDLDDALMAPADRLKIGKCNLRLSLNVTSKEATLQVVYDVLKLTPFYKAFQVTADAPEIYMQEFWASAYVHNRSVRFKMNNKKHIIGLDQFRDILQICPKVGNKKFVEPPLEKEILIFLASLGHSGDIRKITDVNVNKLHQPWRSFAAIINKCLSGIPSYDSLRLSQAQILWDGNEVTQLNNSSNDKRKQGRKLCTDTITKTESSHCHNRKSLENGKPKRLRVRDISEARIVTGSGADEGTGGTLGVPDAPDYDSEDDISWKSSDDDKDDEQAQDEEVADKNDVNKTTQDDEDDDAQDDDEKVQDENDDDHDDDEKVQDDDDEEQTESDDDGDDFVHQCISSSDEEDSDNDVEGANVASAKSDEDASDEKDQGTEEVKDTNTDLDGRDKVMIDVDDTHVTLTLVNPDGQQQSSSVSSGFVSNMLNPNQDTGVDDIFRQHTEATSLIDTPVTAIMEPSFTAQIHRPPTP
ncbi:hypothetical protein Tco_1150199, partial [Tanacetum coccineum]